MACAMRRRRADCPPRTRECATAPQRAAGERLVGDSPHEGARAGHSLASVDNRDRLIALSVALGTLAIVSGSVVGGLAGHVLAWVFGSAALVSLSISLSGKRRVLAWLRARVLWPIQTVTVHTLKPPAPDPVVTDRFRFTTNGMLTPGLAQIDMDGFNHPAYQRPSDSASPYMRIKAQVACSHLPELAGPERPVPGPGNPRVADVADLGGNGQPPGRDLALPRDQPAVLA